MLLWVDLETTGLDPAKDAILEIALLVTDNELNEVYAESHVLPFDLSTAGAIDPYVVKMHGSNGLWDVCLAAKQDGHDSADVYYSVLTSMHRFTEPRTTPICGSTVAFDRAFLRHHADFVEKHFSHRNLDVSVFGELAARWYPEVWVNRPSPGNNAHRALADIRQSIALLKYWRATILREDL